MAWADQVCGVISSLDEIDTKRPDSQPTGDAAQIASAITKYVDDSLASIDKAGTTLRSATGGPAGADQVNKAMSDGIDAEKKIFADLKDKVAKVDVKDAQASTTLATITTESFGKLAELPDTTKALVENKDLLAIAAQAPNCKKMDLGALNAPESSMPQESVSEPPTS